MHQSDTKPNVSERQILKLSIGRLKTLIGCSVPTSVTKTHLQRKITNILGYKWLVRNCVALLFSTIKILYTHTNIP